MIKLNFVFRRGRRRSVDTAAQPGCDVSLPHQILTTAGRQWRAQTARLEQDFVVLSEGFRTSYALAAGVSQEVQGVLARLRATLAEDGGPSLRRLVEAGQDGLQTRLARTRQRLRQWQQVRDELALVRDDAFVLGRTSSFLQLLAFGFAVESARLSTDTGAFSAFVQELRELAREVGEVADRISEHVDEVRKQQTLGVEHLTAGLMKLDNIADEMRATGANAVEEVEELLTRAAAFLQESERQAAKVVAGADAAVYRLQSGDIIRQQSEHIDAALQEALCRLEDTGREGRLAEADQILAVQIEQIGLIRQEARQAEAEVRQALQEIGDATEGLHRMVTEWRQQGNAEDALARLRVDLTRIGEVQERAETLFADVGLQARRSAEQVAELQDDLEKVSITTERLHLQSLNAIVRSASLGGEGAALEVLATQVQSQHQDARTATEGIVARVRNLVKTASEEMTGAATERVQGEQTGAAGLMATQKQLEIVMAGASEAVARQRDIMDASRRHLCFLQQLEQGSESTLSLLQQVRQWLAPYRKIEPVGHQALEALERKYTMSSERLAHERVHRAQGVVVAGLGSVVAGADEDAPVAVADAARTDNLGDNVELF